jgi:hypothetical protein
MSFVNLPKICAQVRGGDAGNYPENREDQEAQMNCLGDMIAIQALPNKAEIVRMGDSWQVLGAASTGLTAVPTTAGLLTLWNGEPGNGKFYAIDSIIATKVIADVTTDDLATIWAQIIRPPMATPADAALTIRSLNGKYSYGGRARTVAASTTLANRWEPFGQIDNPTAAIAGSPWAQKDIDVLGRLIVPPGGALTLTASEVTATASTFRFCIRWHEIMAALVS